MHAAPPLPIPSSMKYRLGYEAVVCVQRAHLHPPHLHLAPSTAAASHTSPSVHLGILVPKGSDDVTVPTNCHTRILPRTNSPVWNQTFCLPVMPNSDVLVLQVFDHRPSNLAARLNPSASAASSHLNNSYRPFAAATPSHASDSSTAPDAPAIDNHLDDDEDDDDDDDDDDDLIDNGNVNDAIAATGNARNAADALSTMSSIPTVHGKEGSKKLPTGHLIGLCLLPVARIFPNGSVSRHQLEIFPRPTEPSVGSLFVAARIDKKTIPMLTQQDLTDPAIIGQLHSTRLLAAEHRFLGIGELAAFLFEEGYSTNPQDNWDRAVTMLAQQLAFRMFQIKSSDKENSKVYVASLEDERNFENAKQRVLKQGGLWDGL